MAANSLQLVFACMAMVLLSLAVGLLVLFTRVQEMRQKRIHPQATSTSVKMAARLENVQAADNFRNLFEVPVLFYALVGMAVATGHTPGWMVYGAWLYVALRMLHSLIHCSYNKVFHRLTAFLLSFGVLVSMWVGFVMALVSKSAA